MRPFETMFDHFEASQKQNNGRNREKLRWKFAKRLTLELIEALFVVMFHGLFPTVKFPGNSNKVFPGKSWQHLDMQ